ncbi:MAG TPA: 3'(2'),5'-bisphosphate nucleotidase CysQ [Aestuariivirgaceae bacterium]|nr:3'(2'),5'-bisphosphate nucleotidase CysQ [Aestuariivirgaceae bacterium]
MTIAPTPFMRQLIDLAHEAGRAIMAIYEQDFSHRLKDDATPVTDADLAAEAVILAGLSRIAPDIPVISEEAAAAGAEAKTGEKFFLVDPLDGTREFLSRNGEFTINIALIEHEEPVAGVVYAPALARMFWGERGHGAGEGAVASDGDSDAAWRAIRVRQRPQSGLKVVASRSHRDARTQEWLSTIDVGELVSAGSSLKFCLLAAGEADLYPRFGRTMEWDTAAGHAVLAAAGGRVATEDGALLTYGKRARGFDNPGFIASGG